MDPRPPGRRAVHVKPRVPGEPGLHVGLLVGSRGAGDEMDLHLRRHGPVEAFQKRQPLGHVRTGGRRRAGGLFGQDAQRRKQRGRAMPDVIIGASASRRIGKRFRRGPRILHFDAERHRLVWRVHVDAHDIEQFSGRGPAAVGVCGLGAGAIQLGLGGWRFGLGRDGHWIAQQPGHAARLEAFPPMNHGGTADGQFLRQLAIGRAAAGAQHNQRA